MAIWRCDPLRREPTISRHDRVAMLGVVSFAAAELAAHEATDPGASPDLQLPYFAIGDGAHVPQGLASTMQASESPGVPRPRAGDLARLLNSTGEECVGRFNHHVQERLGQHEDVGGERDL